MYDVIVVGAGPAGSMAAFEAAKSGFKVLLLEKEKLPRYKLCGGAISSKTIKLLKERGVGDVSGNPINSIKLATPRFTRSYSAGETITVMTYRDKFDYNITRRAEDAGAEVNDERKVEKVIIKEEGCTVKTDGGEFNAPYVFGADGINGPMRRDSGLIPTHLKDQLMLAGEFELRDYGGYDADLNTMEFHFGVVPFGYAWVFPKGDSLTVGVGNLVSEMEGASLKEKLYEFAHSIGLKNLPKPGFHLIPAGGFRRVVASNKVLLCGDSAGFVDVTAGEGTYYAIRSGILAAEALKRVHDGEEKSLLSYQKRCDDEILPDLRGSLKLGKWLYSHLDLFYYMVEKEPEIMKVFPAISTLDESFEDIHRRVLLLGAKNYIKRLLRF